VRTTCAPLLAIALALFTTESASAQSERPRRNPSEITQEELAQTSIRQLSLMRVIQQLRPNWIRVRGAPSFSQGGRGIPAVVVDNMPQPVERLESLRAYDVTSMVLMSAGDATTRFGTGYPNGAILITTVGATR
jgi:hypothetical protein